jgi:hypothetical protein
MKTSGRGGDFFLDFCFYRTYQDLTGLSTETDHILLLEKTVLEMRESFGIFLGRDR